MGPGSAALSFPSPGGCTGRSLSAGFSQLRIMEPSPAIFFLFTKISLQSFPSPPLGWNRVELFCFILGLF